MIVEGFYETFRDSDMRKRTLVCWRYTRARKKLQKLWKKERKGIKVLWPIWSFTFKVAKSDFFTANCASGRRLVTVQSLLHLPRSAAPWPAAAHWRVELNAAVHLSEIWTQLLYSDLVFNFFSVLKVVIPVVIGARLDLDDIALLDEKSKYPKVSWLNILSAGMGNKFSCVRWITD